MAGIDSKLEIGMPGKTHGMWTCNLIQTIMYRDKFGFISSYFDLGEGKIK